MQASHLIRACSSIALAPSIIEELLNKFKCKPPTLNFQCGQRKALPVVVPFSHKVAYNLLKVAARHDMLVVVSVCCELISVCKHLRKPVKRSKLGVL